MFYEKICQKYNIKTSVTGRFIKFQKNHFKYNFELIFYLKDILLGNKLCSLLDLKQVDYFCPCSLLSNKRH